MLEIQGHILTPSGFVKGRLTVNKHGRIAHISGEPVSESTVRQSRSPCVMPGFIDLHVHGGGGFDIMQGGEALTKISQMHAQHGTRAPIQSQNFVDIGSGLAKAVCFMATLQPQFKCCFGIELDASRHAHAKELVTSFATKCVDKCVPFCPVSIVAGDCTESTLCKEMLVNA